MMLASLVTADGVWAAMLLVLVIGGAMWLTTWVEDLIERDEQHQEQDQDR